MRNAQICSQCEHIKYKLKLFNGVFIRRAALHTFMSAYAKVNSLNIKGSKNTYLVYYYVHHVDMLFCIPMWQGRAAFCIISLSVCGPHEIATQAAVGPQAAGCRPMGIYSMVSLSNVSRNFQSFSKCTFVFANCCQMSTFY